MKQKQQLPDRLLEARKKKGISQQDLAQLAKVHFTNVGKYERGEAVPAADILNRIAKHGCNYRLFTQWHTAG